MALAWGRVYCLLGLMASVEGVSPRGFMCTTTKAEGVLWGRDNGQVELGWFTYLDTSFGP